MPSTYRCPWCGETQEAMRLPDDWPDHEVKLWRELERQIPCYDCVPATAAHG